jgi:hypothetical protein
MFSFIEEQGFEAGLRRDALVDRSYYYTGGYSTEIKEKSLHKTLFLYERKH